MMIAETGAGTSPAAARGRHRLSGDVAVHPLHRIGRRERQAAGQHLVERDAERVEIAAGIDRAVHPPGLLGRHVGERAGDDLGRLGRLALARQARRDAEARQPDLPGRAVDEHIGRLDVLVDQAAPVELAERGREPDGEAQDLRQLQRAAEQARRAARRRGPRAPARAAPGAGRAPAAARPRRDRAPPVRRTRARAAAGWPGRGGPRPGPRPGPRGPARHAGAWGWPRDRRYAPSWWSGSST